MRFQICIHSRHSSEWTLLSIHSFTQKLIPLFTPNSEVRTDAREGNRREHTRGTAAWIHPRRPKWRRTLVVSWAPKRSTSAFSFIDSNRARIDLKEEVLKRKILWKAGSFTLWPWPWAHVHVQFPSSFLARPFFRRQGSRLRSGPVEWPCLEFQQRNLTRFGPSPRPRYFMCLPRGRKVFQLMGSVSVPTRANQDIYLWEGSAVSGAFFDEHDDLCTYFYGFSWTIDVSDMSVRICFCL